MIESIDGGTEVIVRKWYSTGGPREALMSRVMFHADMYVNERWDESVHQWTGKDRAGQPLTVTWVPAPKFGTCELYVYEISGEAS